MSATSTMTEANKRPVQRNATALDVAKAVFWSFLGIRKRVAHERDAVALKPLHVIIAGIIGALIFVLCLILLVRFITR